MSRAPVIVTGNQKSGTTAVGALLAAAAGVAASLDIPPLWDPMLSRLVNGEVSLSRFIAGHRRHFQRPIWKEPGLALVLSDLLALLPRARAVVVVRDPRDNARSLLNRLGVARLAAGARPADLPAMSVAWQGVFTGPWVPADGVTVAEILAERWNRFADAHLDRPARVGRVRYEDFLANKAATIAGLAGDLGLEVRHDITAEVDRRFQPAGDRTITWDEFFDAADRAAIEQRCARRMRLLGYDPGEGR